MRTTRAILEKLHAYALDAVSFAEGMELDEFKASRKSQYAVSLAILQIGELAGMLPEEYRKAHAGIPWQSVRGMRNMIAHDYVRVDPNLLWATVQDDLPGFAEEVTALIEELSGGE